MKRDDLLESDHVVRYIRLALPESVSRAFAPVRQKRVIRPDGAFRRGRGTRGSSEENSHAAPGI